MTKVRLRKPVKRNVPRTRIGTRLEKKAQTKEGEIIRIYEGAKNSNGRGGAKLIEAHGMLPAGGVYKDVPEETVIIFLSQFGQCMSLMGQRRLANEYFRSDAGLRRFFKGEAGMAGVRHGEILSRTRFPGQKYPDVSLAFKNNNNPGFGWVWSLPIPHKRPDNFGHMPIGNQVINKTINGNIHGKEMYLSDLIERLGEGVYIVGSCLVARTRLFQISVRFRITFQSRIGPGLPSDLGRLWPTPGISSRRRLFAQVRSPDGRPFHPRPVGSTKGLLKSESLRFWPDLAVGHIGSSSGRSSPG